MTIKSDDRESVLIVEDEADLLELIAKNFRAANFVVETASNIEQARAKLHSTAFDLMIADMQLPDGNGLTFTQELNKSSNMAIIVITGAGDETDRILGLELGADDYIQKPFLQRELLARARAVLRRYLRNQEPSKGDIGLDDEVLQFQGFLLNQATRAVTTSFGENVDLTTLEFDVLAKLATEKNKIVTRDEIYTSAAFRTGDPGRLVDGLISRIRKKLYDDVVAKERIKTVHGRGYTLTE